MLAFMFPGQGAQKPGMGAPWKGHDSWELVGEASELLGRDLSALLIDADADDLRDTRNAQLATFLLSLVVLDAVERLGVEPNYCAGHSLGEYTALTATGALGFDDALRLVSERGHAMHEAGLASPGTMAAVLGLGDDDVEVACRRADADVWVANFNAPGQVVIAGSVDGVALATEHAKQLGAKKVMQLQVAGAFHTPYMAAARDRLRDAIAAAQPRDTEVPVVSNVDARPHDDAEEWSSLLSAQLSSPVRWRHCLSTLADAGVTGFIELGAGATLTGMTKRTVPDARTISVSGPDDLDRLIEWLAAFAPASVPPIAHEGEHLSAIERLVVSPSAGVFTRRIGIEPGSHIDVGSVIGLVSEREVRSPFAGVLQHFIAVDGERVMAHQPIAWLRTS